MPSSALCAPDDPRAGRPQRGGERRIAGPHDGDDARKRNQQVAARGDADAFTGEDRPPGVDPAFASSLSPPNRCPRPAASRMPITRGA